MRNDRRTPKSHERVSEERRGATAVELAVTLMIFVTAVIGVMELSMLVFQNHVVNHAARQVARQVIVHGELAPDGFAGGSWGPTKYGPVQLSKVPAGNSIGDTIKKEILILDPTDTIVTIEWLDGDHRVESRIRVEIASQTDSIVGFFFDTATLTGESVMLIAH